MDIKTRETSRDIGRAGSVGLGVVCGDTGDERMGMNSKDMRQGTRRNEVMKEQTTSRIEPGINSMKKGAGETNKWKSVVTMSTEATNIGGGGEYRAAEPRNDLLPRRAEPMKWPIRPNEWKKRPLKSNTTRTRLPKMSTMLPDRIKDQSEKSIEFHKNCKEKNES